MVSFWDKGNRPVLLVDNHMHHCPVPNIGNKSETVQLYNETKSGVDKKIRMFSCKRKCRRWPMSIFSNTMDVCILNAIHIFYANKEKKQTVHYNFIKALGYQLVDQALNQRMQYPAICRYPLVLRAAVMLGKEPRSSHAAPHQTDKNRGRCGPYGRKEDRKATNVCAKCKVNICKNHTINICSDCNTF